MEWTITHELGHNVSNKHGAEYQKYRSANGWESYPKNTDKQTWKRLVAISTADISGALGVQMVHYISTGHFDSAQGLVWSAGGGEIFFSAAPNGNARALRAVGLTGRQRLVSHFVLRNHHGISGLAPESSSPFRLMFNT